MSSTRIENCRKIVTDPVSGRKIYVNEADFANCNSNIDSYFSAGGNKEGLTNVDLHLIRNRADIDKLLKFANDVRQAGGGEIIDELLMSNPQDSSACLIARALNFDSQVNDDYGPWAMHIDDPVLVFDITESLDLNVVWDDPDYEHTAVGVELPEDIAYVAQAFDTYVDVELEKYDAERSSNYEPLS
jgi:hypothetical protein